MTGVIALFDLKASHARVAADVRRRIDAVFQHGRFILGPEVEELEERLAARAGVRHAVTVSSGTDALVASLMALDIGPGDIVFVPSFTFAATAEAVVLAGARPRFVDVDQDDWTIDPLRLEQAIAETAREADGRPRAIIPVDLFGLPANYDAINAIAKEQGLAVIADAAQSFGGAWASLPVGSLATATATSFYPTKPLGCYGDGGAILTNDDDLSKKLRSVRVHGSGAGQYDNVRIGLNARFDTVQAAILLARLEIFDDELRRRATIAARYDNLLPAGMSRQRQTADRRSARALYTVRVTSRDKVRHRLQEAGIETGVYYPRPLPEQPAYRAYAGGESDFPVSAALAQEVLSLPAHAYLSDAAVEIVCRCLAEASGKGARAV